jgi:hypothetical protein
MQQLLIVAGPSSSGKSFLLEKIRSGDCPRLCEQLGIGAPDDWHYTNIHRLTGMQEARTQKMVIHCDMHNTTAIASIREILSEADVVTALFLHTPACILIERNKNRLRNTVLQMLKKRITVRRGLEKIRKIRNKQARTRNPEILFSICQNWIDLMEAHQIPTYGIDSTSIDNPVARRLSNPWKNPATVFPNFGNQAAARPLKILPGFEAVQPRFRSEPMAGGAFPPSACPPANRILVDEKGLPLTDCKD